MLYRAIIFINICITLWQDYSVFFCVCVSVRLCRPSLWDPRCNLIQNFGSRGFRMRNLTPKYCWCTTELLNKIVRFTTVFQVVLFLSFLPANFSHKGTENVLFYQFIIYSKILNSNVPLNTKIIFFMEIISKKNIDLVNNFSNFYYRYSSCFV